MLSISLVAKGHFFSHAITKVTAMFTTFKLTMHSFLLFGTEINGVCLLTKIPGCVLGVVHLIIEPTSHCAAEYANIVSLIEWRRPLTIGASIDSHNLMVLLVPKKPERYQENELFVGTR